MRRTDAALAPSPRTSPRSAGPSPSSSMSCNTPAPLCAKRDPNANFACALGHQIRQHPVKPGGGEQQRDHRKGQHQNGVELRVNRRFADRLPQRHYVPDRQVRVHLANNLLHRHGKRLHVALRADNDRRYAIAVAVKRPSKTWGAPAARRSIAYRRLRQPPHRPGSQSYCSNVCQSGLRRGTRVQLRTD